MSKEKGFEKSGLFFFSFGRGVISMQHDYKEVDFAKYCKTCEHYEKEDIDDPCNECLAEPKNLYSHKPVEYVENPKRVRALNKMENKS